MRKAGIFLSIWLGLSVTLITGCSDNGKDEVQEVNLYSARLSL